MEDLKDDLLYTKYGSPFLPVPLLFLRDPLGRLRDVEEQNIVYDDGRNATKGCFAAGQGNGRRLPLMKP